MRDNYAEYTQCPTCKTPLLDCNCNCPRCGKRDAYDCKLRPLNV